MSGQQPGQTLFYGGNRAAMAANRVIERCWTPPRPFLGETPPSAERSPDGRETGL